MLPSGKNKNNQNNNTPNQCFESTVMQLENTNEQYN